LLDHAPSSKAPSTVWISWVFKLGFLALPAILLLAVWPISHYTSNLAILYSILICIPPFFKFSTMAPSSLPYSPQTMEDIDSSTFSTFDRVLSLYRWVSPFYIPTTNAVTGCDLNSSLAMQLIYEQRIISPTFLSSL